MSHMQYDNNLCIRNEKTCKRKTWNYFEFEGNITTKGGSIFYLVPIKKTVG